MLAESYVKAIVDGKEGSYKVRDVYEMWKNNYKGLSQHKIQVRAYNSMRRTFIWKELKKFDYLRDNKRALEVTIKVGETEKKEPIYMTVVVNESIGIFSSSGGRNTFISGSTLQKSYGRKKAKIGIVEEKEKGALSLNFYPIVAITNAKREAIPAAKKRGRPKKEEEPKGDPFDAYRAISNDTSYFVCDGLILK